MNFNVSSIELSRSDVKRKIKFPLILAENLAEFIGIMMGDGHLRLLIAINKKGYKNLKSDVYVAGNKKEEEYLRHVMKLFYSLFNLNMNYVLDKRSNGALLVAYSKGIVQFLNKICEIPINRKSNRVFIPKIIKKSNDNIKYAFLRGLADTDFTVTFQNKTNKGHNYPVIKGSFKSKKLIEDLEDIFKELGFRHSTCYNQLRKDNRGYNDTIMHTVFLYGRYNFNKWIELIGFSNSKFHRKIEKFQKDGICPPRY